MEPDEYSRLFELEDHLWWYCGMHDISMVLIGRYVRRGGPAGLLTLDAGCGTGGMLKSLRMLGPVVGVDAAIDALRFAQRKVSAPLVRGSVCRLPFATGSFDLITSLDVIYHRSVPDDRQALEEMARVLRPRGTLLLRVPALDSLRGRHDAAVHTRHRYGKRELASKLKDAGLRPVFVSFVNFFLLPVAFLRRKAEALRSPPQRGSEVEPVPRLLNSLLHRVLKLEANLLRFTPLPLGLSIVAVARKEPTTPEWGSGGDPTGRLSL